MKFVAQAMAILLPSAEEAIACQFALGALTGIVHTVPELVETQTGPNWPATTNLVPSAEECTRSH